MRNSGSWREADGHENTSRLEEERHNLDSIVADLLSTQKTGVLITALDGLPHGALVGFAAAGGWKEILFVTSRNTRKFQAITAGGTVSLVIDNRTNQSEDFFASAALQVRGPAREVGEDDPAYGTCSRAYIDKFPELEWFIEKPTVALAVIEVELIEVVREFQNVYILDMKENNADPAP